MDLIKYRKLLSDSAAYELCKSVCVSVRNLTSSESVDICLQNSCVDYCPDDCGDDSPPSYSHHGASRPLIISMVFLAATFCIVFFSALYYKLHQRRNSRSGLGQQQQPLRPETNPTVGDDGNDDDDGNRPVVDHHVWYIRTVGLNPSIINSIAVLKYNKDDGIVEGTDCSVCLSEFEKDESVRLLPKCNHAFHISCIDTWLSSHTNCPNCRAPIVINSEADNGNGSEMVRLDVSLGNEEESPNIRDDEEDELAVDDKEEDDEFVQPTRRSVSLDSLSALKIRQGIVNLNSELESGLSNVNSITKAEINHNLPVPLPRSILGSSSSGRYLNLQNGRATYLKRSITWNGKFLLSRNSRVPNPTDQP